MSIWNMTSTGLVVLIGGEAHLLSKGTGKFGRVIEALKEDANDETLLDIILKAESVYTFTDGKAEVVDGEVWMDGEQVHSTVSDRILEFMDDGLPFDNLLRFLERVAKNPSYKAQQELFGFLSNKNLPITEDGCFIAYKALNQDYTDIFSRRIDNHPGNTVKMKRSTVDDDRSRGCSKGLHVGAMDYVRSYGGPNSKVVLVKIDPANVVSVPDCSSCQKCRVCEYEVLRDYEGELERPLYTSNADNPYYNDYDEDLDSVDEYDDFYDDGDVEVVDADDEDEDEDEVEEPKRKWLW